MCLNPLMITWKTCLLDPLMITWKTCLLCTLRSTLSCSSCSSNRVSFLITAYKHHSLSACVPTLSFHWWRPPDFPARWPELCPVQPMLATSVSPPFVFGMRTATAKQQRKKWIQTAVKKYTYIYTNENYISDQKTHACPKSTYHVHAAVLLEWSTGSITNDREMINLQG